MRDEALDLLATVDESHWIYRARADLLVEALGAAGPASDHLRPRTVLDVGCGPGATTRFLSSYGDVTAVDPSGAAGRWIAERVPGSRFLRGRISDLDHLLGGASFDVITCFGVLNHRSVEEPGPAVRALAQRLNPGGTLVLEEPADQRLRRQVDVLGESVRRFDLDELAAHVVSCGLATRQARYVHSWAWPIARGLAAAERYRPRPTDELPREMVFRAVASLCYGLTVAERRWCAHGHVPRRGTSVWIVAERCSGAT